jgi:hypothetical protein
MAGVVAGAGAGFHRMSLKTQGTSSGMKQDLKKVVKKPTITTSDERQHGSLRPRRWPDIYCHCLPWSSWEY